VVTDLHMLVLYISGTRPFVLVLYISGTSPFVMTNLHMIVLCESGTRSLAMTDLPFLHMFVFSSVKVGTTSY
jgi:hypothetical protein